MRKGKPGEAKGKWLTICVALGFIAGLMLDQLLPGIIVGLLAGIMAEQ